MQPRANSDKICIPGLRKRFRSVPEYCPITTARCAITFPANFLWGCATSAHQIEGSPLADGAAPSIWQRFAHTPGLVRDGDTGDVACDHYRRYADDVALMGRLGLKAYRFSISWSRVLPQGAGALNPAGLAFYDRLTDALLRHVIAPMVTLYHWDLPAALDDRGGWPNPDAAKWFAEYAAIVFRKLDDRVKLWATLNEAWVVTDRGYLRGARAPGQRNRLQAPLATHQLPRAHGASMLCDSRTVRCGCRRATWPGPLTAPWTRRLSSIRRRSQAISSRIRWASPTCAGTCGPSVRPSSREWICAVISCGRCWITSNGRSAIRSASGSCTWTSRPSGARPRRARVSIPGSSPATARRSNRRPSVSP